MKSKYIPERGDIIWIDFDPQKGREIKKRRPALVLSGTEYNHFGCAIICPLTTQLKGRPFEVKIPPAKNSTKPRAILSDQIKSFDWRERGAEFKEKAPLDVLKYVIQNIAILLTR